MSKYRTSWSQIQEQMNEFALSHTVRYRDPLNKKRFAVPFKTAEKAKAKMDQLKRDGVKEIEITKDILRGKFKEGVIPNTQSAKNKLYKDYIKQGKHPDAAAELVGNAVAEGTIVEDDHEISMARGELEAIVDKATQLASMLQGKSDEGNPLEAWVQSKITKAKDYINSVSDYLTYNPDMKQNEEVNESPEGWALVSKAKDLAKKFANNITKAVAEIEKLEKGLSKNPTVDAELRKYNEETSKELQKDRTDNYKDKNKELEEKFTVQITKKDGTTMELGRYNTAAE